MNKHIELLKIISNCTLVEEKMILSKNRNRKYVNARQLFCYYLRTKYKYRLQEIGNLFGMHHSSIMHNIDMIKTMIEINDKMINDYINNIDFEIMHSSINVPDKIVIHINPYLDSYEILTKLKKEYNTCKVEIAL